MQERSVRPLAESLPDLLASQGLSLRELSRRVGVDAAHLSRIAGVNASRRVSPGLARRIAISLELDEYYFLEARFEAVRVAVESSPALCTALFDVLRAGGGTLEVPGLEAEGRIPGRSSAD